MKKIIILNDANKSKFVKEQNDSIQEVKVMGFNEFLRLFYFDTKKETVIYIIKKYQVRKEIAEIYLKNMYFLKENTPSNSKLDFLKDLKKELQEQNLLIENILFKENLKNSEIEFHYISNHTGLLNQIVEDCQELTSVKVETNRKSFNSISPCFLNQSIEEEVIQVIEQIINLLKSGISIHQIFITNLNSETRTIIQKYSKIFHIPFNLKMEYLLSTTNVVVFFLEHIKEDLDELITTMQSKFNATEEKKLIEEVVKICNEYLFEDDEILKRKWILNDLKSKKGKPKVLKNAIREIDYITEEISNTDHLFLLNANEGLFPIMIKDESYLTNKELILLNLNCIQEQNKLRKSEIISKLNEMEHVTYSYHLKNGKEDCYPSSILKKMNVEEQESIIEYTHSHLFNQLMFSHKIEEKAKFGTISKDFNLLKEMYQDMPYNTYKNNFNSFPIQEYFEKHEELRLSYTTLDNYFHCSYRYFLNQILRLNSYEETFDKKIGTLVHKILEKSYDSEFQFNSLFESLIEELSPTKKEQFFLKIIKNDIKRVIEWNQCLEQKNGFKALREQDVAIRITDNIVLKGIIDKVYYKEIENQTILAIIDYKTGNVSSTLDNLPYGFNMQLPIYSYMSKFLPFENPILAGFYLQRVVSSIPLTDHIHRLAELKQKESYFNGYSTSDVKILEKFDSTYENSKQISGMRTSAKGFYAYTKVFDKSGIEKIQYIVEENIKNAVKCIQDGEFAINPKRINNHLVGCDYCEYQSVCFVKEENIKDLKEIRSKEIIGGDENACMDE